MRRNTLLGLAVVVLVVFGLYFLGSAGAQNDTTGNTPDSQQDRAAQLEPDVPTLGSLDAGDFGPSDAISDAGAGLGGGGGGDFGGGGLGGGNMGTGAPPPPSNR